MTFKMLILISLFAANTLHAASNRISLEEVESCQIGTKTSELQTADQILETVVNNDPDTIFFGENHRQGLKSFYKSSIEKIRQTDERFNCLFLEMDEESQEIFNLISVKGSLEDQYKQLGSLLKELKIDTPYSNMAKALFLRKETGIKLFAVDLNKEIPKQYQVTQAELNLLTKAKREKLLKRIYKWAIAGAVKRNEHMSHRIEELLNSSECQKGIMIVGKAHLKINKHAKKLIPLQLSLAKTYQVSTIDISGVMKPMNDQKPLCSKSPQHGFGSFQSSNSAWIIAPDL